MKYVFIINPKSGRKKDTEFIKKIKEFFPKSDTVIQETTYSGEATLIAKYYTLHPESKIHMFACGGDGTIHEVVNGIANAKHIILSIIPIGTGNDFIKSLDGYNKKDFLDLKSYLSPVIKKCDLLLVNGEYAINTISLGFDVNVAKHVNRFREKINIGGIVPYYLGMLASLSRPLNESYRIQVDNKKYDEEDYCFVVFCNGKYYGGGYLPCPLAQIDDNYIDVCLIQNIHRREIVGLANTYKAGTHIEYSDKVKILKANTIHIDTNNIAVDINLDGEIRSIKNPTVEIVHNSITLALPNK